MAKTMARTDNGTSACTTVTMALPKAMISMHPSQISPTNATSVIKKSIIHSPPFRVLACVLPCQSSPSIELYRGTQQCYQHRYSRDIVGTNERYSDDVRRRWLGAGVPVQQPSSFEAQHIGVERFVDAAVG